MYKDNVTFTLYYTMTYLGHILGTLCYKIFFLENTWIIGIIVILANLFCFAILKG